MRTTPLCTAALFAVLSALTVFGYNHPELQWKSVTTDHFIINYYDKTEPAVYATWKIAEATYESLSKLYDYAPERKIVLSLASYDDESNGWSSWLVGAVLILLPDARFDLRGNTTWLRQVITHELTHHFSLSKRTRHQTLDWTIGAEYASPEATVTVAQPLPRMTLYPSWLAEGVAQAGSDYLNSDCWDTRRDMILRCAVLSNATLSLDEMGLFNHDARGDEMVYNQGYSLVKYIEGRIGRGRLAGIMKDGASGNLNFNTYFKLKTGLSLREMYHSWMDSAKTTYARAVPKNITPVKLLWNSGFFNFKPRFSADGRKWGCLTNDGDDGYRTDLVIFDAASNRPLARIEHAQTSWDFSADGNQVYYIRSDLPNPNGSYLNDLFVADLTTGSRHRLTRDARIYDVAVSQGGHSVAVTRFDKGAFSLDLFSPATGTFTQLLPGELGAPWAAPCFNPVDTNTLVVARIVAGLSQLYLVDIPSKRVTRLFSTGCQIETPDWARNGRIYFSADPDGIFNIYSVRPDSAGDVLRHSTVVGGLFAPVMGASGTVICADYSTAGFGIGTIADAGESYAFDSTAVRCAFDSLPHPRGRVRIDSHDYRPKMLRPYTELMTFVQVATGDSAGGANLVGAGEFGIQLHWTDALQKKSLDLGLVAEAVGVSYDTGGSLTASDRLPKRLLQPYPLLKRLGTSTLHAADRPFVRCPVMVNQIGSRAGAVLAAGASADSGSHQVGQFSLAAVPSLTYQNNTMAPTLGIDLMLQAPMGIPAQISATPYLDWQVWRDLYFGISPQVAAGFTIGAMVSVPVWLEWMPSGYYYNTDINYNFGGVSQFDLFCVPLDLFPLRSITTYYNSDNTVDRRDTNTITGSSMAVGLSGVHYFPIARYASVGPRAGGLYQSFNEGVNLTANPLKGYSTRYLTTYAGVEFRIPLARQINHGLSPYADALYGTLSYTLQADMNDQYLNHGTRYDFWQVAGGNERLDSALIVSHTISASVQLGFYRAYNFFLNPSVAVSYELLSRGLSVNALLGF